MILSFSFQLKIFILAIISGIFMGIFYDLIRVFRKFLFNNKFLIQIEDIIYWIFMAFIIFLVALYQNNGEIRSFFVSGILIGMALYFLFITKYLFEYLVKIITFLFKTIKFVFKVTFYPITFVFNLFIPIFYEFLKKLKNKFKKFKKVLPKFKLCAKIYNKLINFKNNDNIKIEGKNEKNN